MPEFFRLLRADDQFLRHSEWTRRLGIPSFSAIAIIVSLPLLIFVLLPTSLISLAGPSTLIALLAAFLIVFLTGSHLVELACAVPKNSILYNFAFASVGELPAFLIGWLSILESLGISSLLLTSWSNHFDFLFRRLVQTSTSVELANDSWVISQRYDLLAALGVLFALLILCCSLKVVGTISICFLAVTVLIVASCTMVAFFHADPQNWLDAEFFTFGFNGVLRACCAMMVAFCGIESMTSLLEESHNPRGRLPTLIPMLNIILGVIFFLLVMIFSLSINVRTLPPTTVVPEFFSKLNIPAARYLLSVASVCGLSGAALASFLPASRIISSMTSDGLLPLPTDSSSKSPFIAMTVLSLLLCASFTVRHEEILNIVCLLTPCKLLITVCLTFLQHYLPEPVGIPHETCSYKKFSKKYGNLSASNSIVSEMRNSQYSVDTAVFVQMNIANVEANRLQDKLESQQKREFEESTPMFSNSNPSAHYSSMGRRSNHPNYNSGLEVINHGHNCLAESCAPLQEDGELDDNRIHLYHREVPDIPYCNSFSGSSKSSSPNADMDFRKAQGCLSLFLISTSFGSIMIVGIRDHTPSSIVLIVLFSILSFISVLLTSTITPNDYIYRRQAKVPLFPYISFAAMACIILVMASTPVTTWYMASGWLITGLIVYCFYGYWFSVARGSHGRRSPEQDREAYTAIVGDDVISEMM